MKKNLEDILYKHKDDYIRGFDSLSEGVEAWECLLSIVEWQDLSIDDMIDYGCEKEWFDEKESE